MRYWLKLLPKDAVLLLIEKFLDSGHPYPDNQGLDILTYTKYKLLQIPKYKHLYTYKLQYYAGFEYQNINSFLVWEDNVFSHKTLFRDDFSK